MNLSNDAALRLEGGELPDLSLVPWSDNVVPYARRQQRSAPTPSRAQGKPEGDANFLDRFGPDVAEHGFVQVPLLLVRDLARSADLRPLQTLILIDLLGFWFHRSGDPFPGQDTIATNVGAGKTAVKEALGCLEAKGLIRRTRRHRRDNGNRTSDSYDLTPLVDALTELAKSRKSALVSRRLEPESDASLRSESGQEVKSGSNQMKSSERACATAHTPSRADLEFDESRRSIREDLFG